MKPIYTERQGQFLAYTSIQHCERLRSGWSRHAAVFSDHAAERAFDGAHAGEAGLHSACARTSAQHHPDRFARIFAQLETGPTREV